MRTSAEKQKNAGPVSSLIKSSLITSVIAIGLIVLTAVLMQQGVLDENGTQVAVTVVKVLCSVIAAMIAVKNISSRRWLVGALSGVVFMTCAFAVFSALSGTFSITTALLTDIAMGGFSGMLAAMALSLFQK